MPVASAPVWMVRMIVRMLRMAGGFEVTVMVRMVLTRIRMIVVVGVIMIVWIKVYVDVRAMIAGVAMVQSDATVRARIRIE